MDLIHKQGKNIDLCILWVDVVVALAFTEKLKYMSGVEVAAI
jgi:hypothetical protein